MARLEELEGAKIGLDTVIFLLPSPKVGRGVGGEGN